MLVEEILNEFKRTHLQHIEDIILTDGHAGGTSVIEYFQGIQMVRGHQGSVRQDAQIELHQG